MNNQEKKADYEGFCLQVQEYEDNGIPMSFKDLLRFARQYNCEIPKIDGGELKFETI